MAKSNGELKIEKGVPIPPKATGLSAVMRKMNVGDSFLLPAGRRNSLPHIARDAGIKVTARLVAKGQVRVWRVK